MDKQYREVKCSDRLPKVPGYYTVSDNDNPYRGFFQAEYEGEGISGDGWKLKYTWLEPIPSPEPSINTEEMEEKIVDIMVSTEKRMVDYDEDVSVEDVYREIAENIAQLFNQQPALVLPTEDEIDEMSLHYVKNLKGMSLGKSITARIDFIKGAKAIIELIKSKL